MNITRISILVAAFTLLFLSGSLLADGTSAPKVIKMESASATCEAGTSKTCTTTVCAPANQATTVTCTPGCNPSPSCCPGAKVVKVDGNTKAAESKVSTAAVKSVKGEEL